MSTSPASPAQRAGSHGAGSPDEPGQAAWNEWKGSHRYSWMLNGWMADKFLTPDGGGTEFVTIGVPDDFIAVRVGFANINRSPWVVRKVIACASASWNDLHNPIDSARVPRIAGDWSTLTFQNRGCDRSSLVTAAGAPKEIIIAENGADANSGETSNPTWTFTDWVPCASIGADPATGMRVLMLRALVPSGQLVTYAHGMLAGFGANAAINKGYHHFIGGMKWNADLVSDPPSHVGSTITSDALEGNHIVYGQMMCLVQVLTRNAGIVGMVCGDSHQAGTSAMGGANNFVVQSLLGTGQTAIGTRPFGVVCTAVGGVASQQIFPRMLALLHAVQPAFVILPGWTFNERDGEPHANERAESIFLARLLLAVDEVRSAGSVPILVTPFPRDAASIGPVLNVWSRQRETLLAMRASGELVFDATPLLGEARSGQLTGTYRDGLSSDAVHPNDAGHATLARAFIPFLRGINGSHLPLSAFRQKLDEPGRGLTRDDGSRIQSRWIRTDS